MCADKAPGTLPTDEDVYTTPVKDPLLSPRKRPSSASTASGDGSGRQKGKYTFQRDRRHRDAPGGTRNIQKIYRWEEAQRVTKFRALLPLTNNMEPYILGDFREMQGALQAADRAVLAFYGRAHPLGATNLPHELYEVEKLEGPELEDFLLSLEPEGWDRSKAVTDRASKRHAGKSSSADELLPGAEGDDSADIDPRAEDGSEQEDQRAGHQRRAKRPQAAAQPSYKALANHTRHRLRELQAEQELKANLGSALEEPAGKGLSDRTINVFEADRPKTAGPDTRVTRNQSQFSWANRWSSRFARAYDYAADLRHIARCRAAGVPVEVWMMEDVGCSRCGMAGHTARSSACPIRMFTGEPSTTLTHATPDQEGPLPLWHDKLTPELEGVLRAVRNVAGDCLDVPEMSLFQPLLESLSPDALLAVGCLLEAQILAGANDANGT